MSVPMWEQGSAPRVQSRPRAFLGCMLTLLFAMASHAHGYNGEVVRKSGIEVAAPAHAFPGPQLKQKPDGSSIGTLIAAIENALVKSWSSSADKGASGEPEKNAGVQSADYTPPEPHEIVRNETFLAKTQAGPVQNVSIHYKTVRVAEVVPLDAVLLEGAPAERNIALKPRIVKLEASGMVQAQPVSAVAEDVQPQKLAVLPRFAKVDEDAGRASPPVGALQRGAGIAIYDIERGMVYLPNGETLEAHSGIGPMRDNPSFVDRRNRGPTPPHIYDLKLRESLFHGVEAIRLTPVEGDGAVYGRVGLLAHTYMLGRRGDSNGCVVFKDYRRFLAAFKKGQIKQMVVVPRLREAPPAILTAFLSARND